MRTVSNRWKWISMIAFCATVVLNILANLIPLGGKDTGEISALYPSPLTPAPITFMIWAVIYVSLYIPILYQFRSENGSDFARFTGPLFLVSCIANMAWIFSWHFGSMTLSMIFMVILLVSLILLKKRINAPDMPWNNRWYLRLPFGLYTGWITVATVSQISVWLMSLGFTGFGLPSQLLQVIVLLIAGAILTLGILVDRDPYYGIAAVWGYAGILIRHLSADMLNGAYPWAIGAAFFCEALFLGAIGMLILRTNRLIRRLYPTETKNIYRERKYYET